MYKRRVSSGLTYGQGAYSGGRMHPKYYNKGGKYCTGDGFQPNPRLMYSDVYRYNQPMQIVQGGHNEYENDEMTGDGNAWTQFRKDHAGSKKSLAQLRCQYYGKRPKPKGLSCPKKKARKGKKLAPAQKKKLQAGASEFRKFYAKLRKDHPEASRQDILCSWHSTQPNGAAKIRKLKKNNCPKEDYN
jgi:hypothetical protein